MGKALTWMKAHKVWTAVIAVVVLGGVISAVSPADDEPQTVLAEPDTDDALEVEPTATAEPAVDADKGEVRPG